MTYRGVDPESIVGVRLVGLSVQPIGTPALSLISLAGRDGALVERQGRGGKQIDLVFALLVRAPEAELPLIDQLNAWGWGGCSWGSWEEAIRDHVAGLARGYGYTISVEAAKKYCPPNWEHWYNATLAQMNMI